MSTDVRNHRCEPVTVAERAHYVVPHLARWSLLCEIRTRKGWVKRQHYGTDAQAALWCRRVGIAFPEQAVKP